MPVSISFGVVGVCALVATAISGYEASKACAPIIIDHRPAAIADIAGISAPAGLDQESKVAGILASARDATIIVPALADEQAEFRMDGDLLTVHKSGKSHGWVKSNAVEEEDYRDSVFTATVKAAQRQAKNVKSPAKNVWKKPTAKRSPARRGTTSVSSTAVQDLTSYFRNAMKLAKPSLNNHTVRSLRSIDATRNELRQFLNAKSKMTRQRTRSDIQSRNFSR